MKLVKSIFGFAVIVGVLLYIFFPSRSDLLRAIENPRLSHEERLSAARQLATFYPPSAEDKAWAEAARKESATPIMPDAEKLPSIMPEEKLVKKDESGAEAVRQNEAAQARIAEEARREAARQQAVAKAAADAPRLRAEAEEAKRKAAVRDIAEKYSGHGR